MPKPTKRSPRKEVLYSELRNVSKMGKPKKSNNQNVTGAIMRYAKIRKRLSIVPPTLTCQAVPKVDLTGLGVQSFAYLGRSGTTNSFFRRS